MIREQSITRDIRDSKESDITQKGNPWINATADSENKCALYGALFENNISTVVDSLSIALS